jgi:hypothetical protein
MFFRLFEQAAVEPGDVVVAVVAAFFLHGGEELFDAAAGFVGIVAGVFEQVGEDAGGEQLFVFGEHAEQALDEEVGDFCPSSPACRRMAAASWANWPAAWAVMAAVDFSGRSFSGSVNTHLRICRASGSISWSMRISRGFVRVAGEGGVDDDAFAVADDEQRRVFELQGVVGELLEGGVEVAARLLVLPAEMAALPDIGPAVAATGFAGAALEAVVVGITRLVDAEQIAEVTQMLPAPRPRSVSWRCFPGAMNCSGVMAPRQ